MNIKRLAASMRRDLASVPGFTVAQPGESAEAVWRRVPQTTERRDTVRCGECDKVIRMGGTGTKLEMCRDCHPGEE